MKGDMTKVACMHGSDGALVWIQRFLGGETYLPILPPFLTHKYLVTHM